MIKMRTVFASAFDMRITKGESKKKENYQQITREKKNNKIHQISISSAFFTSLNSFRLDGVSCNWYKYSLKCHLLTLFYLLMWLAALSEL